MCPRLKIAVFGFIFLLVFCRAYLAFAGGPGRAFDAAIKFQYDLTDRWRIGPGYRTLEGGVDNDTVYNIAWFHYAFILHHLQTKNQKVINVQRT